MAINHWVVYFFAFNFILIMMAFSWASSDMFQWFFRLSVWAVFVRVSLFCENTVFLDIFWQCWCVFSITLTLVDWMDVMVCTKTVPRASRGGCGNTNVADTDEPPNQVGYSKTFLKVILTRSILIDSVIYSSLFVHDSFSFWSWTWLWPGSFGYLWQAEAALALINILQEY